MTHPPRPPLLLVDPTATPASPTAIPASPTRKFNPPGQALWSSIMFEYQIEDCAGLELLAQACHAADRAEELRAAIDADGGPTVRTKAGPKAHPAVRDELQCRAFICRTLERMGLNLEPVRPIMGRPPKGG